MPVLASDKILWEPSMSPIEHVFVLMLENRSFDHMLGVSPFTGFDAVTHKATQLNALPAGASNSWNGNNYPAGPPAVDPIKNDPYHEFEDVLEQLCGADVRYRGGPYPAMNNSGFVSNFAVAARSPSPGDVMKVFTPERLPVLSALARAYAVCDSWFCSLPGPTWPNRFFALGASSGDLDHTPTSVETAIWETVDGFQFQNGSIFDVKGLSWRIYAGNKIFTLAHALKGIHIWDIQRYANFAKDISNASYAAQFTWIEPNYGHVTTDYPANTIDHRPYDHSSILATVERSFNLQPLTERDRTAPDLRGLASLVAPRIDADTLDEVPPEALAAHQQVSLDVLQDEGPPATRPEAPIDEQPNLPGFIFVASQRNFVNLCLTVRSTRLVYAANFFACFLTSVHRFFAPPTSRSAEWPNALAAARTSLREYLACGLTLRIYICCRTEKSPDDTSYRTDGATRSVTF
jgi:Phosphoesterase family